MIVEIISIGNELISGKTLNTNSSYIAERLLKVGIPTKRITVVGDDPQQIQEALRVSLNETELLFITGGLGPTHDDITKQVLADYLGDEIVFHPEIYEELARRFDDRGLEMTESNRTQAMFPRTAELIPNDLGTARGMKLRYNNCFIFVVPGVPSELEGMIDNYIVPELKSESNRHIVSHILRTCGIPESALYDRLKSYIDCLSGAVIAFLPDLHGVDIQITVNADESAQDATLQRVRGEIRERIGRYVYGEGEESLEQVVAYRLREKQLTIAVAESCTGGLLSHRLTNISGSSDYFERGVISYSNRSKIELLGVREDTITRFGAVSRQAAREMAIGIRTMSGTDLGVAITGIAGPTGGTADKPLGTVFIALADSGSVKVKKYLFKSNREDNKLLFSQKALFMMYTYLEDR